MKKLKKLPAERAVCCMRAACMLTTGLKTPRIKSDQRDELPEMARRPERKNEKIKKSCPRGELWVACGRYAC